MFFLLFIGHWCSFETAADTCIPTVRGEPFVQFMENKNCEVDEKLLKLFNPESFNESVASKSDTNFMCIGFMDALNLAPEDLCSIYDPLSVIPDSDFCSDKKMMDILGRIVNGSVFDNYNIVVVSNYTIRYCKVLCTDYNELCWAFGTIAKVVVKQSSMSTTAPTTTEPTTAPTTEPTTATTTEPTTVPTTEPTTAPTIVTTEHPEFPSLTNRVTTGTDDPGDDPTTNDINALLGAYSAENGTNDNKDTGDSQEVQNSDGHGSPGTNGDSQDNNSTSNISNTSENATATTTTTNITATATSPTNVTTNEEVPSTNKVKPGDINYEGYYGNVIDKDDQNDSDVDLDNNDDNGDVDHVNGGVDHTDDDGDVDHVNGDVDHDNGSVDHVNGGVDQTDDNDDGYSYWHFAAILLFILFLGVAGYLASHNRKKVRSL